MSVVVRCHHMPNRACSQCRSATILHSTLTFIVSEQLQEGAAEVFGTPLLSGQPVSLRGQKVAVSGIWIWNLKFHDTSRYRGAGRCSSQFACRNSYTLVSVSSVAGTIVVVTPQRLHVSTPAPVFAQIFTWEGCAIDVFTDDFPIDIAVDSM